IASVSSRRLRPTSSMRAFAPSKSLSRCRSRKAGWPARTRRPSHTPSPRTKPESKTDTTARSRGTSSPLTQMRMRSLRASSSKSCVPCATVRNPMSAVDVRREVLDDDHRLAGVDEPVEQGEQLLHVGEVQAAGRLVEDVDTVLLAHVGGQLEPL